MTELAEDPSVFAQATIGAVAHWLNELSQYMPLKELHAADPHLQSIVLSENPSTLAQGAPLEQVLVEEVQKRPDAGVHSVTPHVHAAPFAAEPSVVTQSGMATSEHWLLDA